MNRNILEINNYIQRYKTEIVNHSLYKKLNSPKDIAILMENHIYAVWDFMSLLKALQSTLTCTSSPWKPVGNKKIRRLINSIVLEEESDVDIYGEPASHYEMYIDAMNQCGANTNPVKNFVSNVSSDKIPSVNEGVDSFLKTTFDVINNKKPHEIASAFTFGREDLIPDMFTAIVKECNTNNKLDNFVYYLERHIELDGGEHGPLAMQLVSDLCGDDGNKWEEVKETAVKSLIARKQLWDFISSKLA